MRLLQCIIRYLLVQYTCFYTQHTRYDKLRTLYAITSFTTFFNVVM